MEGKTVIHTYGLGADWYITIEKSQSWLLLGIVQNKIENLLKKIEVSCSRFIKSSHLNIRQRERVMNPEWEILPLILGYANEISKQTEWFFNINWWSQLIKLGYWKNFSWWKSPIDLGWFVKGYAIDQVAKVCIDHGVSSFLVNAWWDVFCRWEPQQIVVQHPFDVDRIIGNIAITDSSLCSSSIRPRRRRSTIGKQNKETKWTFFHHYTLEWKSAVWPVVWASVIHPEAMIADSLATTFLVCPVEKIQEIAHQNQVEFFIVFDDMSTIQSPSFPLVDIY